MPTAKERLSHLLELAGKGPVERAALAGELADLLLDESCPEAMRPPVQALLEMTVREADDGTRATLAARLGGLAELPLELVNEFYLSAPARVRREILTRNELAGDDEVTDAAPAPDTAALVDAAREASTIYFAETAGRVLDIAPQTLRVILADASAEPLAVLCKGAHLDRATFSTMALLKGARADAVAQLCAFDTVPQRAAERLARHWRIYRRDPVDHVRAAE